MVLLHIKGSEKEDEFIYQCKTTDNLNDISKDIIYIHNKRLTIRRLANAVVQLSKYGPCRPEVERFLSHKVIQETIKNPKTINADLDPNGVRIGEEPEEKAKDMLETVGQATLKYIDVEKNLKRELTTAHKLDDYFDQIKTAVNVCYPEGLPLYDPVFEIISGNENVELTHEAKRYRDENNGQLWFGCKKLLREDELSKYIGSNEKTKIIIKISTKDGHMPVREPTVDENTRKKMMSYWHKKQETDKKLSKDDDNSYLESEWANPNSLKDFFTGLSKINIQT